MSSRVVRQRRKARFKEYREYLKSAHWRDLKNARAALVGWACEDCGSRQMLEGHHIEYRNLLDCTSEDIRLLCQPCHGKKHNRKVRKDQRKASRIHPIAHRVRQAMADFKKRRPGSEKLTLRDLIDELTLYYDSLSCR